MSDPADKSDDLIAELAKLMANTGDGAKPAVQPLQKPAPIDPNATSAPTPAPFRIPGMDAPISSRPSAPSAPAAESRGPVVGAIRIPGMDQPAPVATSAPVSKFDFGKPVAGPSIRQEPLVTLAERIAARNSGTEAKPTRMEPSVGAPPPQPPRVDLKPVSENKSFAEGPALQVTRSPAPAPVPPPPLPSESDAARESAGPAQAGDFHFDFGFTQPPPVSITPPRPLAEPSDDPIGDLIAADMAKAAEPAASSVPTADVKPAPPTPVPVAPMLRAGGSPVASKPAIAPIPGASPRPVNNAPIPLKPVSVAPRPADSDRFATSPGAGLNMKAPASQPLNPPATPRAPERAASSDADSDPMKEIESLIGEAVRVELSAPGPVRVQAPDPMQASVEYEAEHSDEPVAAAATAAPAPVVPPLNAQFAPRRSGLKDDSGTVAAEDAILAAAAATGAQVGRVEPTVGDESRYRRPKVKPARISSFRSAGLRQYIGMAVAGTLLLAAGLGLYWVLNMGRTANVTGATAPELTADATPIKVKPDTSAQADTEAARSPVLEQMAASGTAAAPSAEQLVSTDETAGGTVPRDVTAAAEADNSESGLANRKVRTVTVRPDGTIVSGDDAVAGTEELPVDRPNVPTVPSTESTNLLGTEAATPADPIAAAITGGEAAPATETATAEADIQPVMDPTVVAPTPITFPVRSEATRALALDATPTNPVNAVITGAQTPNGQIDLLAGGTPEPQQVAAADPTPATASTAAAYVQLSSSPSQADAQASLKSATSRFGSLFGGNKLIVQSADLGQKGTWYRVRLPTSSLSEANRICAEIKSNGGDCIATGG